MINSQRHPTEQLLHDIACAFVEHPEDITIASQPSLDGAIYFALKGHPGDEGRLVGTGGCHVDALTFLVALLGQADGDVYTFRLITRQGPRQNTPIADRHVVGFDPRPARELLLRILVELGFDEATVEVGPGSGARHALTFNFTINAGSLADYELLLSETKVVIFPASDNKPEKAIKMRPIEALGTLFRAIAKREGVRFSITAQDPR